MQLLLVRHALPLRSGPNPAGRGQGADPELSDEILAAAAARLPETKD